MGPLRPLPSVLAVALVALAACAPAGEEPDDGAGPPNVVLLVLDTVRPDHLGCYGYERDTSPVLDALAAESTLFETAVSAAPWTLPSHASMFTGLPPSVHQAHHEHPRLVDAQRTLAERLAERGYETAGFCNNPWITAETGMTQGFQQFTEVWRTQVSNGTFGLNIFVDPEVHGFEDAGAGQTLEDIRRWLDGRQETGPFLLFINLIEAHSVYNPPPGHRNRFTSRELTAADVREANIRFMRNAYGDRLTPADLALAQSLYDGEIAYLDSWLARFLELLRERDLLDTSLLVVTSDHGEGFAEHRSCGLPLIDHQLSVHEELLRVPLIMRFPREPGGAAFGAGLRLSAPVSTLDILPTVMDVVGADGVSGLAGVSLAASAPDDAGVARRRDAGPHGEAPAGTRLIRSEYYRPLAHLGLLGSFVRDPDTVRCLVDRRLVAVRSGSRKLILSSRDERLAFDLAADPGEQRRLEPGAPWQPLADAAGEQLARMQELPDLPSPQLTESQKRALRALGYLR